MLGGNLPHLSSRLSLPARQASILIYNLVLPVSVVNSYPISLLLPQLQQFFPLHNLITVLCASYSHELAALLTCCDITDLMSYTALSQFIIFISHLNFQTTP